MSWQDLIRDNEGAIAGTRLTYKVIAHKKYAFQNELRIKCSGEAALHVVTEYDPQGNTSIILVWTTED